MKALFWFVCFALMLFAGATLAQKPTIRIGVLPPPGVGNPSGDCKDVATASGYYETKDGRSDFSDAELGHLIADDLRHGYVVTVYPRTSRGIFVLANCTNITSPK